MRIWVLLALGLGIAVAAGLVGWFGLGSVVRTLGRVGWPGFIAFVAASFPLYLLLGLAWFVLTTEVSWTRAWVFGVSRIAREAAAELLPFSTLGGYLVGARAAVVQGVSTPEAFGTGAVDLVTELLGQIAFLALGALIAVNRFSGSVLPHPALTFGAAMAVLIGGGAGFVFAQRRATGPIARLIGRMIPVQARELEGVAAVVEGAYRDPAGLAAASALHLTAWVGGALQAWFALRLLGRPIPLDAVIALEASLALLRSAAFVIPGGLGVQEGTYALIGPLFGLPAEAGLALSLVKRARDVVIGLPALLIWQAVEGGRLFKVRPASS